VDSAIGGTPRTPPTSTTYAVVASDMNLNFLTEATTYDAAAVGDAKIKVDYLGLSPYADLLGMGYQYWPCDQPAAGTPFCASQCRTPVGTGQDGPCVMTPAISGFSCGVDAGVRITGGDEPEGLVSVEWLVQTPWTNYGGGGKLSHQTSTVSGYSDNDPLTPP
jgi:hypothetical protein